MLVVRCVDFARQHLREVRFLYEHRVGFRLELTRPNWGLSESVPQTKLTRHFPSRIVPTREPKRYATKLHIYAKIVRMDLRFTSGNSSPEKRNSHSRVGQAAMPDAIRIAHPE